MRRKKWTSATHLWKKVASSLYYSFLPPNVISCFIDDSICTYITSHNILNLEYGTALGTLVAARFSQVRVDLPVPCLRLPRPKKREIIIFIFPTVRWSTGCSGKIVFFHNLLQPLPRLHRCKRPWKLSTQCECTVTPIGWWFFVQPIVAEYWRGRGGKLSRIMENTIFNEHPVETVSGITSNCIYPWKYKNFGYSFNNYVTPCTSGWGQPYLSTSSRLFYHVWPVYLLGPQFVGSVEIITQSKAFLSSNKRNNEQI